MKSQDISKFIMDTIEDIVYVSDPVTHELYYINGEGLRKFNLTEESQWRRKKCHKIFQGFDVPCSFCTNCQLGYDEFYNWEYYNPLLDKYFYIQNKMIEFEGVQARLEIAKDISALKKLERELNERLEEERVVNLCIETLQSKETPAESIDKLLQTISRYYEAERGYIFDIVDNHHVNNTYEWCAEGVIPQIDVLQEIPVEYTQRWFDKFADEGGFYIDSLGDEVDQSTPEYEILTSQGISSVVTAPFYDTEGELVGFIGVDNPKKHGHEVSILITVTKFISDFFEKSQLFETLHRLSYDDNLTGLKNRNSYSIALAEMSMEEPQTLGIVYVDINGLKIVNDKFGHKIGDRFIISVADTIKENFSGDAYRIGGDEFVILTTGIDRDDFDQKVEALAESLKVGSRAKASVGASWSENSQDVIEQIEQADALMYIEKQHDYDIRSEESDVRFAKYYLEIMEHTEDFEERKEDIMRGIQAYEGGQT